MNRHKVTSTHLKSVGYSPIRKKLEVEFTDGSVYVYNEVPPHIYDKLREADKDPKAKKTVGEFFADHVRFKFKYKQKDT